MPCCAVPCCAVPCAVHRDDRWCGCLSVLCCCVLCCVQGRGIVIVGGGLKYFLPAWVTVNVIRRVGASPLDIAPPPLPPLTLGEPGAVGAPPDSTLQHHAAGAPRASGGRGHFVLLRGNIC